MVSESVQIVNPYGLHARAALQLVRLATTFDSTITLTRDQRRANGKSIMDVLMLAASQGAILGLEIHGTDEQEACRALVDLIQTGFDELTPQSQTNAGEPEIA